MEKNIEYYKSLPYTRELIPEPEGGWFVRVKELPGCMSQGDTPEEAMAMITDAMEGWLEVALDHDMTIPEPRLDEAYSGKFVVRLPKSLHRKCVEQADQDGVSLNQWIVATLAETIGTKTMKISSLINEKIIFPKAISSNEKFYLKNDIVESYKNLFEGQLNKLKEWSEENKYRINDDINDQE